MKMNLRRIVSGAIISSIVISLSLTSMAASNGFVYEKNYPSITKFTKADLAAIQKERQEIQDVADGKKILGSGVQPEWVVIEKATLKNAPSILGGGITPQWGWTLGATKTHQMLNSSALVILNNDKGTNVSKYFYSPYSPDGAGIITRSGDLPDQIETDYMYVNVPGIYTGNVDTFQGHFFDPDTKKNWVGNTSPTAMSRFLAHYNNAKYYYWRDRTVSLRELGMAMHYLADLNAPHHASNNTALPLISNSTHAKFEGWVDNNFSYASISSSGSYPEYSTTLNYGVEYEANLCALNAKYYSKYAATFSESNWKTAAGGCIPRAQRAMTAVYYKFLKDVGEKV